MSKKVVSCQLSVVRLCFLMFFIFSIDYRLLTIDSYAQTISSTELIEKAKEHNNKIVEYRGEVVGDVMVRGNFAWVNLNDGQGAIGIWGKRDLVEGAVTYKGGYKYKGDVLSVKGVFHRACPQHGGDLDIHFDKATRVKEGYPIAHRLAPSKIIDAISLFIVALGFAILCKIKVRRKS